MDIMQAVANYGLPAIIAFWLLTKTTKSIDNLTKAVNHQASLLQMLLWEAQRERRSGRTLHDQIDLQQ